MVLFWENFVVNWLSFSTFKIWLAILSELLLLWMIVGGIVLDYWFKDMNCFKPFLVILNSQLFWNCFQKYDRLLFISNPIDAGRKLNIHKTFRRRPGRLLNVLCTFNVRPVSTGAKRSVRRGSLGKIVELNEAKVVLLNSCFRGKSSIHLLKIHGGY